MPQGQLVCEGEPASFALKTLGEDKRVCRSIVLPPDMCDVLVAGHCYSALDTMKSPSSDLLTPPRSSTLGNTCLLSLVCMLWFRRGRSFLKQGLCHLISIFTAFKL